MSSLIHYLLESAVCLSLFYIVYRILLRNETYFHLNRIYLVSSLIFSCIIPILDIPSPFFKRPSLEGSYSSAMATTMASHTWGMMEVLLVLYALGAALFLLRFFFHIFKLLSIIKRHRVQRYEGMNIVSVNKDFSPFSFFNIVFINAHQVTPLNLRHIIAHERIHMRQYHSLDILLIELVTILQWFNPFVWPYKKSLQETHEYLADYGVIAQGFSAVKYRLLVFEQHVGAQLFEFANNFKQSQIKRRITMMTKIKSRSAARLKLLLILPLASLLVLAFAEPRSETKADLQGGEVFDAAPGVSTSSSEPRQEATKKTEHELQKEKMAQMKKDLHMLKEKEAAIREKLEKTEDPEKKKELKGHLAQVLEKKKNLEAKLAGKGATHGDNPGNPEEELALLKNKEKKLQMKLAETEDPEAKAEIKKSIADLQKKQEMLNAKMESEGNPGNPSFESLKSEYKALQDKELKIKEKLKVVDDPAKKAELESMLSEVVGKQQKIREKLEQMKAAEEAGKKK